MSDWLISHEIGSLNELVLPFNYPTYLLALGFDFTTSEYEYIIHYLLQQSARLKTITIRR
jgi:hypothetical protein